MIEPTIELKFTTMKDSKFILIPFFAIFLLLAKIANAQSFGENLLQRTAVNISLGLANYGGELQERTVTFGEANIAAGVGMTYALTNHFKLRGELMYGKIGGDDRLQNKESLKARNLNFKALSSKNKVGCPTRIR